MAHRLLSKVLWSIQLICLVLAGGGTVQGLEVPQGDSQALVHGPRRSRSLYNKHPFSSLVLPQGTDSSEHSDLSSWTRNGYDSDEPTLRRLASSDPFMPSSSNVNLFQSNSLLGAKGVPSGSTTDTMGFQRRASINPSQVLGWQVLNLVITTFMLALVSRLPLFPPQRPRWLQPLVFHGILQDIQDPSFLVSQSPEEVLLLAILLVLFTLKWYSFLLKPTSPMVGPYEDLVLAWVQ
ncbi:hypothetical protein Z043_123595, partial [Scleropages formosus]